MVNFGILLLIILLFYILGKSADLAIENIRQIGEKVKVSIFFLGIVLGFLTSLPDFAIGINSVVSNVQEISFGDLMGGMLVLFGLILGVSLIINRKIETDKKTRSLLPILAYSFLPLVFGIKGEISSLEGLFLVIGYLILVTTLYIRHKNDYLPQEIKSFEKKLGKNFLLTIIGLIFIILSANLIVRLTLLILKNWKLSQLLIGALVFSLGTNLPELMVTIRSWKKHIKELSLSNLIGSTIGNSLVVGILSFIKPIPLHINFSYYLLMASVFVLFVFLYLFYRKKEFLTRGEGIVLIAVYLIFLLAQIAYESKNAPFPGHLT